MRAFSARWTNPFISKPGTQQLDLDLQKPVPPSVPSGGDITPLYGEEWHPPLRIPSTYSRKRGEIINEEIEKLLQEQGYLTFTNAAAATKNINQLLALAGSTSAMAPHLLQALKSINQTGAIPLGLAKSLEKNNIQLSQIGDVTPQTELFHEFPPPSEVTTTTGRLPFDYSRQHWQQKFPFHKEGRPNVVRPMGPPAYSEYQTMEYEEALRLPKTALTYKQAKKVFGPAAAWWMASYKWRPRGLPEINPEAGAEGLGLGPYTSPRGLRVISGEKSVSEANKIWQEIFAINPSLDPGKITLMHYLAQLGDIGMLPKALQPGGSGLPIEDPLSGEVEYIEALPEISPGSMRNAFKSLKHTAENEFYNLVNRWRENMVQRGYTPKVAEEAIFTGFLDKISPVQASDDIDEIVGWMPQAESDVGFLRNIERLMGEDPRPRIESTQGKSAEIYDFTSRKMRADQPVKPGELATPEELTTFSKALEDFLKEKETPPKDPLKEHAKEYVWGVKGPGRVANQFLLKRMSSEKLKKLLLEEIEGMKKEIDLIATPSTEKLEALLSKLLNAVENLDISIDYLAASITGEDPLEIKFGQAGLGRLYSPSAAKSLSVKKD